MNTFRNCTYFTLVATLILTFLINGCSSDENTYEVVDSPGVATGSISAETHVRYTGSQSVTIEVVLQNFNDPNTGINLIAGDTLKASTIGDPSNLDFGDDLYGNLIEIANQVKTLERGTSSVNDNISGIWYYTTTDAKYRHKEFTVSFIRNRHNDAPNSVVSLPPDFSISVDELANSTIVSRSGPITVRWHSSGDIYNQINHPLNINVFSNCSNGDSNNWEPANAVASTSDQYVIPANEAFIGLTGDCIVTIGVESSLVGSADSALYPTSTITGHQYRTLAIATAE